jgi:hypothetical protein
MPPDISIPLFAIAVMFPPGPLENDQGPVIAPRRDPDGNFGERGE